MVDTLMFMENTSLWLIFLVWFVIIYFYFRSQHRNRLDKDQSSSSNILFGDQYPKDENGDWIGYPKENKKNN